MENDFEEYVTFFVTAKDGSQAEMAIVAEFTVGNVSYVAACAVKDDTINEEEQYIYRCEGEGEDLAFLPIESEAEYAKVAEAYLGMDADV